MNKNRRAFLKSGLNAGAAGYVFMHSPQLLAANKASTKRKLIWILLRGGMDSIHAVIPTFDKHLSQHRASLLKPISKQLLPLHQGFALHPALSNLHQYYQQKQMIPIVAVASPYRSRSHFEAQDMIESGLDITDHNNGWLARAMQQQQGEALAIAHSIPISLRGSNYTRTWYPSTLPDAKSDLYERLAILYQDDNKLSTRLTEGMQTRQMISMEGKQQRKPKFTQLAQNCGELLAKNPNAHCAMLEMGGWDTHNAQVNRLDRQFTQLDTGIASIKNALGKQWQNTVIIVATEFGRTVAINGTKGTDHGTASAMFLAGGALNGGKVLGNWPGLDKKQLYQGRDLQPTSDIRTWLATTLQQHWQLNRKQINHIFPNIEPAAEKIITS